MTDTISHQTDSTLQTCKTCHENKPLSKFGWDRQTLNYKRKCKECANARVRELRAQNLQQRREAEAQWREENRDAIRAYNVDRNARKRTERSQARIDQLNGKEYA